MAFRYHIKKDDAPNKARQYYVKEFVLPEGTVPPEKMILKQKRDEQLLKEKKEAIAAHEKELEERTAALVERTKNYEIEYANEKQQLIDLRRQAKLDGNFFVEPEPKLIFAIRIKGILKLAPKPRKVLQLLRLRQVHNGVFLKVNKAILEMLKLIQPYITFGYPTLGTVRQLIYKRGYGKVAGNRTPIIDNEILSDALGEYGIHGCEDLVHEIYTVGPNFKQANNFLWPFKLNTPRKGFVCKRHAFTEQRGGDWGNREEFINELVKRMI